MGKYMEQHPRLLALALFLALSLASAVPALAVHPLDLAGFHLGGRIEDYRSRLRMSSDLPIRHMECIHEVEIAPISEYKSGLIAYGTCDEPGRIVRIKLKYKNATRSFYNELLSRFKARFGEPYEWRGDPFHVVIAWKWSFVDEAGNRVSLILQHNLKDEDQKMGNSVKLTLTSQIEAELACFEAKEAAAEKERERRGETVRKPAGPPDWEMLIPR